MLNADRKEDTVIEYRWILLSKSWYQPPVLKNNKYALLSLKLSTPEPPRRKSDGAMTTRSLENLLCAILVILLAGCSTPAKRDLSHELPPYASLPNGYNPLNPTELLSHVLPADADITEGVIPYFERVRGHPLNIVELSGGGQNGAFGAGFLKGWRERGTRPQFDIVTGVSTGALLSTHAFLGTDADDAVLEEIFTGMTQPDVYRSRSFLDILEGSSSVFDNSALESLIAKYITQDVLDRVAEAYDDNRRLWVGTTNLDYNQTWVWNMTLIAKEGGPEALELYRKVLRASASPPVAFPPVEIDGHLFVDGGVRQNVVIIGLAGTEKPKAPLHGPGNVYLIHNGRQKAPPNAVSDDIEDISGSVIGIMFENSMESVLLRAYFAARARGYTFNLVEIPEDATIGKNMLAFDAKQMRAGFDAGVALAKKPDPWSHAPPIFGELPPWALKVIANPDSAVSP